MPIAVGIPTSNEHDSATLKRGEKGFRIGARGWHQELVAVIWDDSGLVTTPERREHVGCIRSDFEKTAGIPEARVPLRQLQTLWDKSKTRHRHVYQLLRRGYGQRPGLMACTRIPPYLMGDG
jgi:sulfur relay (sulfurtransferase) DsrC/TusE family protein